MISPASNTRPGPIPPRALRDTVRGRGIGIVTGSIFAFGWAAYGVTALFPAQRMLLLAVSICVSLGVAWGGLRLVRQAATLPPSAPPEREASRRGWRWFWLNLVVEILLLNIAVNVLARRHLEQFFIPAISLVVGLHFLPMAVFFRVRSYWAVGGLMALCGLTAIAAIADSAMPVATASAIEGLVNAGILWAALIWGSTSRQA